MVGVGVERGVVVGVWVGVGVERGVVVRVRVGVRGVRMRRWGVPWLRSCRPRCVRHPATCHASPGEWGGGGVGHGK